MTNESVVAGKRSFRSILATVIAIVVIVGVFASTAFAGSLNQYDVEIIDNGEAITVTTSETEPIEILNNAGIALNSNDKLDITAYEQGNGGTIVIMRLNTVHIQFDDNIQTYSVYSTTVGEALSEIGVTVRGNDKLNYKLSDSVKNGMIIRIKSAFTSTLIVDGEKSKYAVVDGTVEDLLKIANVTLGEDDYTQPSLTTALSKDIKVTVYRVSYETETKTEKIKYKTVTKADSSLSQGKTKVVKEGRNGVKEITYRVKYVNGEEAEREAVVEKTARKCVNKVVKVGTADPDVKPNGVTTRNGYTLGQKISGKYTHYCACATCNGNSRGITSSGRRISNGMSNPYYVACNWLPLGTVIKTMGHTYTVVDRGGSGLSRQGRIDIFTPEGHSACYRYGTGPCTIEIVRLGW